MNDKGSTLRKEFAPGVGWGGGANSILRVDPLGFGLVAQESKHEVTKVIFLVLCAGKQTGSHKINRPFKQWGKLYQVLLMQKECTSIFHLV